MTLALLVLLATPAPAWKMLPPLPKVPPAASAGQVTVKGATLFYETWGHGDQVVVLLHGGAGHSHHWAHQIPALARHFTVLAIDARGHGRSTRDDQPMSYVLMATDVAAVLDQLNLTKVSLVGWSDGGAVALEFALAHPQRVHRLVIYGTNINPAGGKPAGRAPTFDAYFALCQRDYAALAPNGDWNALLAALRPMWRSQPNHPLSDLAAIEAPTLVLDGAHDEIVRPEHLEAMARSLPHGTLHFIPDASHFALFQQPAAFNDALVTFLRGQPDAGH